MVVTMNSTVFWNVTPCSLVRYFHLQGTRVTSLLRFLSEHGSGTIFRIFSKFLLDYTASHPRIR